MALGPGWSWGGRGGGLLWRAETPRRWRTSRRRGECGPGRRAHAPEGEETESEAAARRSGWGRPPPLACSGSREPAHTRAPSHARPGGVSALGTSLVFKRLDVRAPRVLQRRLAPVTLVSLESAAPVLVSTPYRGAPSALWSGARRPLQTDLPQAGPGGSFSEVNPLEARRVARGSAPPTRSRLGAEELPVPAGLPRDFARQN